MRPAILLAAALALSACGQRPAADFADHQALAAARLRVTAGYGGQPQRGESRADRQARAEQRKLWEAAR